MFAVFNLSTAAVFGFSIPFTPSVGIDEEFPTRNALVIDISFIVFLGAINVISRRSKVLRDRSTDAIVVATYPNAERNTRIAFFPRKRVPAYSSWPGFKVIRVISDFANGLALDPSKTLYATPSITKAKGQFIVKL